MWNWNLLECVYHILHHFTTDSEDVWEEFTMRHLSEGCYIGFLRWKTMEQQLNVNIWLLGAGVFLSMMFTFDTLSSFIWHELNYVFIGGWTPQADEEWGGSRCLEMSIQVAGKSRQQERCNMRGTCYAESFEASRARSLDFRRLGLKSPGKMDWSAKICQDIALDGWSISSSGHPTFLSFLWVSFSFEKWLHLASIHSIHVSRRGATTEHEPPEDVHVRAPDLDSTVMSAFLSLLRSPARRPSDAGRVFVGEFFLFSNLTFVTFVALCIFCLVVFDVFLTVSLGFLAFCCFFLALAFVVSWQHAATILVQTVSKT